MPGHRPGGRPACPDSVHFVILEELGRAKGGYKYCEFRHCRAAYDNDTTNIAPISRVARPRNYRSYLSKHEYFTATQLQPASPFSADSTPTQSQPAASPSSEQSISSRTRSQTAIAHPVLASSRASRARHPYRCTACSPASLEEYCSRPQYKAIDFNKERDILRDVRTTQCSLHRHREPKMLTT
ncbi:hypothetical protein GQ600_20422 [Phytophthora cactorum]|nr:hypothetical protein GQ600_20422 [Phytophthora cactorum]